MLLFKLIKAFEALFRLFDSPARIGHDGEAHVSRLLRTLDPERYKQLNDIMLPSRGKTSTTQIDHIVVSNYGIFCIETKAYKGWIFGNANQEQWKQVIYRYKESFYNPLWQNYAHVKAIEDLLGKQRLKKPIVSLVEFPNADKIRISGTNSVGSEGDILSKIKSYVTPVYSDTERDNIFCILVAANIDDEGARKLHNKEVRKLSRY